MLTAECPSTDGFHPFPLPARCSKHPSPIGFHPSKPTIARLAGNINSEQQNEECAKNHAKQQFSGYQFPEEIDVQRNQSSDTPPNPLGNSTDSHC
jgi:hypothetical protein